VIEGIYPARREVLILRELEGFSYEEIFLIIDAPLGRLCRVYLEHARICARLCEVTQETKT
jgi:DNA-directed RNA polymerase specialized sigma24 family protein